MRRAVAGFPRYVVRSFLPASMPFMSRRNYRWELLSSLFFPFSLACMERGVAGVIAQKAFGAGAVVIATIAAAPAMANITSFIWARWLRGRDRVRAANALQIAVLVCVAMVAFAPLSPAGAVMLAGCVILARSFMTGIITARSDIWRSNYPRNARARATGKFTTVTALIVGGAAMVVAWILGATEESAPESFRYVYLAAAAIGVAGVWCFSRIRWRGRAEVMEAERRLPELDPSDPATPRGMLAVLRTDVAYRRFMTAQFVLGIANLAADAPFIIATVGEMGLGYGHGIALSQGVPFLAAIGTIPLWARLLDRVHVVRFRVFHSWFFVLANVLMGIGLLAGDIPTLYVARIVLGAAYGGGMLAWNLGHHDFAPRNMATIYMGIHATLTGVRGAIAPFIGTAMYSGWGSNGAAPTMLAWRGMGAWVFFVFAIVSAIGGLLFLRLHRQIGDGPQGARRDG